ncbi:MAG: hypothetical protein HQM08_10990 [Candidatus Riflebacteria bacterium]|nr:hypothetical protein [Candidatus Riflebacteria bacterium]
MWNSKAICTLFFCFSFSAAFSAPFDGTSVPNGVNLGTASSAAFNGDEALKRQYSKNLTPVPEINIKEWIRRANGEQYQQTQLLRIDAIADAYLIRKLDQMPWKLVEALLKGNYPQKEDERKKELNTLEAQQELEANSGKPDSAVVTNLQTVVDTPTKPHYTIGRTHPINVERLCNKFREIMQSFPNYTPVITMEHEWAPETRRYLFYGFWQRFAHFLTGQQKDMPMPLFFRSKLFLLLGCGWTSRYAFTGYEKYLVKYIMSCPDRSVQIHDVFRECYRLTLGDVYLTMLTAENVLAGNPYRSDRDKDPLQRKLAYIRNDSAPSGDNYGAWYHFYGIALYGLVRAPLIPSAVGEIESFGSLFLEGPDKQEDYINRLGAIFGTKLKMLIESGNWKKPLSPTDRTDYMTLVPVPEKH